MKVKTVVKQAAPAVSNTFSSDEPDVVYDAVIALRDQDVTNNFSLEDRNRMNVAFETANEMPVEVQQ
jgi:hypothetical protein